MYWHAAPGAVEVQPSAGRAAYHATGQASLALSIAAVKFGCADTLQCGLSVPRYSAYGDDERRVPSSVGQMENDATQ